MEWPLPLTKTVEAFSVSMPMADLYAAGVRAEGEWRAWIKPKQQGRMVSDWGSIDDAFKVRRSWTDEGDGSHQLEDLDVPPRFLAR